MLGPPPGHPPPRRAGTRTGHRPPGAGRPPSCRCRARPAPRSRRGGAERTILSCSACNVATAACIRPVRRAERASVNGPSPTTSSWSGRSRPAARRSPRRPRAPRGAGADAAAGPSGEPVSPHRRAAPRSRASRRAGAGRRPLSAVRSARCAGRCRPPSRCGRRPVRFRRPSSRPISCVRRSAAISSYASPALSAGAFSTALGVLVPRRAAR